MAPGFYCAVVKLGFRTAPTSIHHVGHSGRQSVRRAIVRVRINGA